MKSIAQEIRSSIAESLPQLSALQPDAVMIKPAPEKWSKQEILGHLIDSACNNHQRFVRAAYDDAVNFPPYHPDEWVKNQHYNNVEWHTLVNLWSLYNEHLCHVLENLPESCKNNQCNIGKEDLVTLEFVARDYLGHLRHHLGKILEK